MSNATIGPVLAATIVSRNYQQSIQTWCDYLYQSVHSQETVTAAAADLWGYPDLSGAELTWLANELGEPWLRIIDAPKALERTPFSTYGWLALEISVQDVDQLFSDLTDSPFEIIGEPANLDVSDDIRAMQVVGLDGEVLYLTQIKADVPPFEIARARCAVDRLFIPVCLVEERTTAMRVYESRAELKSYQFDTKITVINKALGYEIDRRHPIATVQLAGEHMVELDEIAGLAKPITDQGSPQAGISSISFQTTSLADQDHSYPLANGPQAGHQSTSVRGPSGEMLEFIASNRAQ